MRKRRLYVRLANVMRVDNRASVAYAAVSARSAWALVIAVVLCIVAVAVVVAAADASGCAKLSSQFLPLPPMPC